MAVKEIATDWLKPLLKYAKLKSSIRILVEDNVEVDAPVGLFSPSNIFFATLSKKILFLVCGEVEVVTVRSSVCEFGTERMTDSLTSRCIVVIKNPSSLVAFEPADCRS